MNKAIKKTIILLILLAIAQIVFFFFYKGIAVSNLKSKYLKKIRIQTFNYEKEKQKIKSKFIEDRYLATGKNVYERIYNRGHQTISQLIKEIAIESVPKGWSANVRVEEFTNFILLLQPPKTSDIDSYYSVIKYLVPIVKYTYPYLKNIAIYNKKHQCILYFDGNLIKIIRKRRRLRKFEMRRAVFTGGKFLRYNSEQIKLQRRNGHFFVPVVISGFRGSYEILMLLDSGASKTVIPLSLAQKTGSENLELQPKENFSTANGTIQCPIVERRITVENITRNMKIAVSLKEEIGLLGIDFFENKNYIIDSDKRSIYIWEK